MTTTILDHYDTLCRDQRAGASSVLLVTPHAVVRCASTSDALARARRAGARTDCYVVKMSSLGELSFRGRACGRRLIGRDLGCGPSVVARALAAVIGGQERS